MSGTDPSAWGTGLVPVPIPGPPGPPGPPNTLTVGNVTQAITPAVTISGTSPNQIVDFELPQGTKGDQGNSGTNAIEPNFSIGTVETGGSGDPAVVTLTGTYPDLKLNFVLPIA